MTSVPAKLFVNTGGSVLPAGGSNLVLNGLYLTTSTRVPIGTVAQFSDADSVGTFFGANSAEATEATVYFLGWDGSFQKPGNVLFAQYNTTNVSAYLRGGNISAVPLATLQGYNGTLAIIVDGNARSGAVNLSGATSFSNAASLIQTALNTGLTTIASFTASLASTGVLTVTGSPTGTLAPGQTVVGAGVTGTPYIVSQLTGTTGAAGTYQLSGTGLTVGSESMTTQATPVLVTYDSTSGAFVITSGAAGAGSTVAYPTTSTIATNLLLTAATGATLSQGAVAATPSAFMDALADLIQNWVSFTTLFNPDVSGFANKLLFAQWANGQGVRYLYVPWDTDPNAATQAQGTFAGFGAALQTADYNATAPVWSPNGETTDHVAAFLMGMIASVDFDQVGGRVSFAAKSQGGLTPTVTTKTAFLNLAGNPQVVGSFGNGYNVYAAIATANADFQWFQRSTVSGVWKWADAYINAVWLDNLGQLAIMDAFGTINSIPFNPVGANVLQTVIQQQVVQPALQFGMMSPGVILTAAQKTAVNNAAGGKDIATTIQNQGYYILIQPASPAVRANRGPWQVTLYYADAGVLQSVNFGTVAIQ